MPADKEILQAQPLADAAAEAAAHSAQDSLSIISLMLEASLTVQLVMFLLFLASLFSWSIIFSKALVLRREKALTAKFEKEFWAGGSMESLFNKWSSESKRSSGMSEIFVSGYKQVLMLAFLVQYGAS